ncbi:helix-turn-helix transcriptional regulator [Actinomycetospora sp. OC33-EN08]|uniref:Helix-turn-helix transcriptional regulator n=1 Tax=Actinomycetospora aurantiaca TaxID=3129233 RepID=A0ABU8MM33_9PSEU
MTSRTEGAQPDLAGFLRAARRRAGAPGPEVDGRSRRVPGLRREELGELAGVSVDYVKRLEQGRSRTASPQVLDALARALGLDDVERLHLHDLAAPPLHARGRRPRPPRVHAATLDLLDTFDAAGRPAFVLGRRLDVLAWNGLACRLIVDFDALAPRDRNAARVVFLSPHGRALYPDWDTAATQVAASLRFEAGRHPGDPLLLDLIGELRETDPHFEPAWSRQRVHRRGAGPVTYRHPLVGELTLRYQALTVNFDADQTLYVGRATPGSEAGLAHLREAVGAAQSS